MLSIEAPDMVPANARTGCFRCTEAFRIRCIRHLGKGHCALQQRGAQLTNGCFSSICAMASADSHCLRTRRPKVCMPLLRRKHACGSRQPPYMTIFSFTCSHALCFYACHNKRHTTQSAESALEGRLYVPNRDWKSLQGEVCKGRQRRALSTTSWGPETMPARRS